MTELTQVAMTPRERFMQQAQEQLAAFEQRERNLRKKDHQERARQLNIPLQENSFTNQ